MQIDLANLYQKRDAESRSLSAENFMGEKGKGGMATFETSLHPPSAKNARDLGPGWKLSPCLEIPAGVSWRSCSFLESFFSRCFRSTPSCASFDTTASNSSR